MQTSIFKPVYGHYSALGICVLGAGVCTNKELAYAQWKNQAVLLYPPRTTGMKATDESYVRAFPRWTDLQFTPELSYFLMKAELPQFTV